MRGDPARDRHPRSDRSPRRCGTPLREDPDVILVGELRDLDSISLALTAAETGIQVLATLHTSGAARTIDRMVNVFPAAPPGPDPRHARRQLAHGRLAAAGADPDGSRRLAAVEILVNTHAAASMIRSGNTHKLESVIQSGAASGMQSLDASSRTWCARQIIPAEEAHAHALDKAQFERVVATREVA